MFLETCIQNVRKIIEDVETESGPLLFSEDDMVDWFKLNGEKTIPSSINRTGALTLKTMLWNLDNLRPPVRINLESQLVDLLVKDGIVTHGIGDPASGREDPEASVIENEPTIEIEPSAVEIKTESGIKPLYDNIKRKEDWFDKMLNIVAAVVRGFMLHEA